MKKISLLFIALLLPILVSAASFGFGEDYSLRKDEAVKDDLYVAGSNAAVSGQVFGDLFMVGANVFAGNNIDNDFVAVGGTVNSTAAVGGDLRIAGANVVVGGG